MRVVGGHSKFRFEEYSGEGYLYAWATDLGVQLQVHGYTPPTRTDHINFGLPVEEAACLEAAATTLLPLVPPLEATRQEHIDREAFRAGIVAQVPETIRSSMSKREPQAFEAGSPVVHNVQFQTGDDKVAELLGGKLEADELVVVGGLAWARDQLIIRFDMVNSLIFRPDAFGKLAVIGANQPDFPAAQSIWSRLK